MEISAVFRRRKSVNYEIYNFRRWYRWSYKPRYCYCKEILTNEPDAEILFVGTKKGLEGKLVPREGFDIKYIDVQGFRRKLSSDTFKTVGKLLKSFGSIRKILKNSSRTLLSAPEAMCVFLWYLSPHLRKFLQ